MNRLDKKVAFITGAGAGIGRATALMFARKGAAVAIADIDTEGGHVSAEMVTAAGGSAVFLATDVTDEVSVQRAIHATVERFGHLDILFNCAGGPSPVDSFVTDVDLEVWDRTLSVDLKGTMLCCRHAIPEILKTGGGSVVNMSSGAALRGGSNAHSYTAAKGAIVSLTRALAGAYAKQGLRTNAICAGRIMTERTMKKYGLGRYAAQIVDRQNGAARVAEYPFWLGQPDDIANIALFLASDESRMITGAAIQADGGRSSY